MGNAAGLVAMVNVARRAATDRGDHRVRKATARHDPGAKVAVKVGAIVPPAEVASRETRARAGKVARRAKGEKGEKADRPASLAPPRLTSRRRPRPSG